MPKNKSHSFTAPIPCLLLLGLLVIHSNSVIAQNNFTLYLIDVEGGGATLFVASTGETLLIDTGNGGANAARDMGRIIDAMQDAGATELPPVVGFD
ncbi:MAG: hypothetical protein IIC60_11085 [Proteobacteria bacterium]|nr:hypothetical protein [Pseudomonadota bacterium]